MEGVTGKKFRYCILYIPGTEQHRVVNIIEGHLPQGRGEVFYPCMEYYRRGEKAVKTRAIFPGYVFLYTDMDIREVHNMLIGQKAELNTAMRELSLAERRAFDPDFLLREGFDSEVLDLSDVNEEEEVFLDHLRKGDGLLTMSSGYECRDKGGQKRYVVMEGPLKAFEDRILAVDKHNRKAFLEFKINERRAQAGFNCMPKTHWFPEEDSKVVKLADETEVDITELVRNIMMEK